MRRIPLHTAAMLLSTLLIAGPALKASAQAKPDGASSSLTAACIR